MTVYLTLRVLGVRLLDLEVALPWGYLEDEDPEAEDELGSAVIGQPLEAFTPFGFAVTPNPGMEPAEWE